MTSGPTSALFGDLDGDGRSEVIFSSGRRGLQGGSQDIETLTSRAFRVDPESEVLVPMSEHPLPIGHILSLNDLDGDGRDDILTLGPSTVHWGGEELTVSPVLEAAGGDGSSTTRRSLWRTSTPTGSLTSSLNP